MELTTTQQILLSPIIQYGFAGFCVVLMGIIIWLIRNLLGVLKETTNVIATNSEAIRDVAKICTQICSIDVKNNELLLQRPCIARFDIKRED